MVNALPPSTGITAPVTYDDSSEHSQGFSSGTGRPSSSALNPPPAFVGRSQGRIRLPMYGSVRGSSA
jgi:hypothetical protein